MSENARHKLLDLAKPARRFFAVSCKSLRIRDDATAPFRDRAGTGPANAVIRDNHASASPSPTPTRERPGMRITCAWCQREGEPASLGERAPLDDPAETHGICRRHTLRLLDRLPSRSFPGVRLLFVVSQHEAVLYENLQRELAGVGGVRVMLDRRQGERRVEHQDVPDDHRRDDRRVRQGEVSALGYTVIRFGRD